MMRKKKETVVYIASSVPDGGIWRYRLSERGELEPIDLFPISSPNYAYRDGDSVWVTLHPEQDPKGEGAVLHLSIDSEGNLSRAGEEMPTGGVSSCHLAVSGEDVYVANYSSGSVTKLGQPPLFHEGRGVDPARQEMPHCHCTVFSPDKRYVLVCDLGLDTIFVYDRGLREISRAKVPDGEGCRHLVFSHDGHFAYVMNELGCSVSVFSYGNGKLTYLSTTPTRTYREHEGADKGSAIKLSRSGKYLFITNRGEDEVVTLKIKSGGKRVKVISRIAAEGHEPRDFELLANDRFAIVTNQFSDSIVLYRVSRFPFGRLRRTARLEIPAPLFVSELKG